MPSAAPSRCLPVLGLLALVAIVAALVFQLLDTRRHRQELELMRAGHKLLEQENRLLRQHLEAERLQSAALARMLQSTSAPPPPPPAPAALSVAAP